MRCERKVWGKRSQFGDSRLNLVEFCPFGEIILLSSYFSFSSWLNQPCLFQQVAESAVVCFSRGLKVRAFCILQITYGMSMRHGQTADQVESQPHYPVLLAVASRLMRLLTVIVSHSCQKDRFAACRMLFGLVFIESATQNDSMSLTIT